VCRLALDELDDVLVGRTIDFRVQGDTVGHWDVDRLGQLTSNLLANALAHGTPGEPVVITVDGQAADAVRMEVSNRGVVRPEILPVIFEPFSLVERPQGSAFEWPRSRAVHFAPDRSCPRWLA